MTICLQSPNSSRRSARLAAIQAVYLMRLSGETPERTVDSFKRFYFEHDPGEDVACYFKPNIDLFQELVFGVPKERIPLDDLIVSHLVKEWTLDRLMVLVTCLLECGVFELRFCQSTPTSIIVNEYIELAKDFFEDRDAAFVHNILDKVAHDVRAI